MHQLGVRTYAPVCIRLPRVYIILILSHALQSIRDSKCESPDDGENSTIYLFLNFFLDEKFGCETRSHNQHRSNRYWATHAKTMTRWEKLAEGDPTRFRASSRKLSNGSMMRARFKRKTKWTIETKKSSEKERHEEGMRRHLVFIRNSKKKKIKEKGGGKGFERGHGRGRGWRI